MSATTETVDETTANEVNAETAIIPTNRVICSPNSNPRRSTSKRHWNDLRESIRRQGVLQPVVVRPHPEREGFYELAAGYTRYAITVDLEIDSIPALVKSLSDKEMMDAATTENIHRQDMTPMDEGEQAKRLLSEHSNDRELVCTMLGWSESKLQSRIHLTHCIDEVRQALADERINLRHAQIMSSLREDTQKKALELVEQHGLSAKNLADKIEGLSMRLDKAPFDKSECHTCPHNSSLQATMFDSGLGDAQCLNRKCFDSKLEKHLVGVKQQQAENFNRLEFDRDVAQGTTTVLATNGSNGVGVEQFRACQQCEYYGAIISTGPGSAGAVRRHVCFNLTCHEDKVAAYQNLIATDANNGQTQEDETPASTTKATTKTGADTQRSSAKAAKSGQKKPAKTPARIAQRINKVHRNAAGATVATNERLARCVALVTMMKDTRQCPDTVRIDGVDDSTVNMLTTADRLSKAVATVEKLSDEQINTATVEVAAKAMGQSTAPATHMTANEQDPYGATARSLAERHGADLSAHFTMDRDYLEAHTKPVVAQLLNESGFARHYEATHGEGSFKKLASGKKTDILDAVDNDGYDFTGFIPSNMALTPARDDGETASAGEVSTDPTST